MKVIFNADDFGLTPGVNRGIVHAHQQGVVKSTTLMIGMPAEQHAVELAASLPGLKIGLHLRFTAGAPLTKHPNLTGNDGNFLRGDKFWVKRDFSRAAIHQEATAQVEHFLRLGIPLSHIDSHHHAHTHPQLKPVIEQIAAYYRVPLRGHPLPGDETTDIRYHFCDKFYAAGVDLDQLIERLIGYKSRFDLVEVMCHPAYVDPALSRISSYSLEREKELAVLTDPLLSDTLKKHRISVTDYSELDIIRQGGAQ